ncbi:NAD(P)-binding protein [Exidia glandulosa HHB12029]|uniref:NAD(P)-binding protein n=1 Tax=Exidia glandulosa HHB12029 TaxID=1314781 RepID=A0A166B6R7_EXIGL|nr:NAD(P)-binding protein [Exidia glandulosa HHB12029]
MATKRIVTVFGATGSQGGSVAKYLLEDGTFAVRAVTRNAESPAAQGMCCNGAEIVIADLNKPETLPATVKGSYGVSGVTDSEFAQGKALVDAAKTAGVQHFVWWYVHRRDTSRHDTSDAESVDEYLKASGIPRTSLFNSAYFENLVSPVSGFQMCKKQDDGTISVEIPSPADSYMPFYSVDQTGGWVLEALKHPDKWIGKDMHAIGQHITPRQIANTIGKLTGKTTVLKSSATVEEFRMMGMSDNPVVKELYLNLKCVSRIASDNVLIGHVQLLL